MLFEDPIHVGRPNLGSFQVFTDFAKSIFETKWLSNSGPLVEQFEKQVANYLGVKHCVAVTNATVGLELVVESLNLTGEVIVPSYTFVATVHSVYSKGLTPIFVDIDENSHSLDPQLVENAITQNTSAILAVHLWGRPAEVQLLQQIADKHNLALIFDSAHAFGNSAGERKLGGFGNAEVFSFHATKFFNTFEGGAITTNDSELAEILKTKRNFGFVNFDEVVMHGTNAKMTEICAAMGLTNFKEIEKVIRINKSNFDAYETSFEKSKLFNLFKWDSEYSQNYQYVVLELNEEIACHRDSLITFLHNNNIRARKYFWPGVHEMEPYKTLYPSSKSKLSTTELIANKVIVLPTGTSVTPEQCQLIANLILTETHRLQALRN